ncbi:MAG: TolC family protein [Spirosomaceae bacterium]|nr:TolC family protein [Spirosomataceae bacterium]
MKINHTVLLILFAQVSWGQQVLSLDEAIDSAVSNNPAVQIQKQQTSIATNNVSKANTGQLPTVDAVGLASYTNNYTDINIRTFQPPPSPDEVSLSEWGVQSLTANVGVEASYVLWDGGAGSYRYQLLSGLSEIEADKQSLIINNIIKGTVELYLELVKIQNQVEILNENVTVTRERISKLRDKRQFSKVSDLDVLQVETSLNQDLSTIDQLNLLKQNLQTDLKTLMNDITDSEYSYEYPENTTTVINTSDLRDQIKANNPELQLIQRGIYLSATELELEKASLKPTLVSFGNAGYFGQRNDVQQLAQLQTVGATVGIKATYRIFDGGSRKIKVQNAKVSQAIETNKLEQRTDELLMEARKQLQNIVYLEIQLQREKLNAETYQLNYEKTVDRYDLGKLPEITLREAELALINSKVTIANYQVDIEKAKRLVGLITGQP